VSSLCDSELDHYSGVPLYRQLAAVVRGQIERGEFAPGQRIPAERDYIQQYGLSRDTVYRAMLVLRREGLIATNRGGSRVRVPARPQMMRWLGSGEVIARMPTEPERQKYRIDEGVPLLIIQRRGRGDEIYPADRVRLRIGINGLAYESRKFLN
jgi:DNA-binding GntR family transcriptional regulator